MIPAPGQIHSDDFAAATLLDAGSTAPGSRSCSLSRKRPRPRKPVESSSGCDAIATGCPPPTTTPFHHPPRLTPFSLSRGFQSHQDSSRVAKTKKRFVVVDSEGARGWRWAGVRETTRERRSLPSCSRTSGGRTASRLRWGHHRPPWMIGFWRQILWPLSCQFQEKGPGNRGAFLATRHIFGPMLNNGTPSLLAVFSSWQNSTWCLCSVDGL